MMSYEESEYQATIQKLSPIESELKVEVPWAKVKLRLDQAYAKLKKEAVVKGFRRGKVPRKMLEGMLSEQVNRDVGQELLRESMQQILKEKKIKPVVEPEVDNPAGICDGEAFCFSATLQLLPEIDPKRYFNREIEKRAPRTSEKEVNDLLESMRDQAAEHRPVVGRSIRQGDIVKLDIMGKIDEEVVDRKDQIVEISDPPREPYPGLAAQIMGREFSRTARGEYGELEVTLKLPPSGGEEGERTANLYLVINDINEKIVPNLDDAFARSTGQAESLEQLRETVRESLLKADSVRAESEAKNDLVNLVLEDNDIPSVPALVEQRLEAIIVARSTLAGVDPKLLLSDETIREKLRDEAERLVRKDLLIEAIGDKEGVAISDDELERKIEEIAESEQVNASRLRAEWKKDGKISHLQIQLRQAKIVDLIWSRAVIKEKPQIASPQE